MGTTPPLVDHVKVRQYPFRLRITQAGAVRRAGVGTANLWGQVESGKHASMTLRTLYGLSVVLDVRMRDLLVESPDTPTRPRNRSTAASRKARHHRD